MIRMSFLSGKRKLGTIMESDDDRESEDARYLAMREAQKRRDGVLMSEDEAFKFFIRGPGGTALKDHSNMAHAVAKMQLHFCQRALADLYIDSGYESCLDDETFSEGFRAGVKAAMERIKGG